MDFSKEELLNKLRTYALAPNDESTQYKEKIKQALMKSPEFLYSLHEESLESELFYTNDNNEVMLNIDAESGELLGEVDRYFGESANVRPYIFLPETQTSVKNYVCYQVMFDNSPKYNDTQKYTQVIFTIFVNGKDREDYETGLPRHDLIASIIREKFNWSNIFGAQTRLISSKESTTDNNYLVRTLVFQLVDTNGIVEAIHGQTSVHNYKIRR